MKSDIVEMFRLLSIKSGRHYGSFLSSSRSSKVNLHFDEHF